MAYAALSSLMNTLNQLLQPNQRLVCGSSTQQHVQSAYQSLSTLQVFLEDTSKETLDIETVMVLEKRIRLVVYKLEDRVDSSLKNIILADDKDKKERAFKYFGEEVQLVEKEVDSLKKEVMQMEFNKHGRKYTEEPSFLSSRRSGTNDQQNVVVGMEDDFNTILDRLSAPTDELIVIPIVGMGGIGKTTLARKVYDDSSVRHRYDTRGWVTISEAYNERQMLLQLISLVARSTTDESFQKMSNDQLAEMVYRGLKRRRYLIVVDDLWSGDAWDQMQRSFPNDNNKSRILLTTRLKYVAEYVSCPDYSPHNMSFLSLDDSWNLFSKSLFRNDPCPSWLEKIGKHIIHQCQGLPLSIVVVAGLLGKMEPTHDNWKRVEENLSTFFGTISEHCEAILSFSYNYLPQYLKACFLYFGGFPEDVEICVSGLIRLWIAEQFIMARSCKSLELVAEKYLQELIDRSLILVGRRRANGRIRTCKIHDALRQLCIRKAQIENVVHIRIQNIVSIFSEGGGNQRRVMIQITESGTPVGDVTSTTRSLVFKSNLAEPSVDRLCSFVSHLKLLKVLDVLSIKNDFSSVIPQLVHLRYIAAKIAEGPSLANLWNLQTILLDVLEGTTRLELPPEIWTLSEMRHLNIGESIRMPSPFEAESYGIGEPPLYLNNLQTLELISSPFVVEILRRTPNLIKLKISFLYMPAECSAFFDCLNLLQKLETLLICFVRGSFVLSRNILLPKLKQLNLGYTHLSWKYMAVLAKLPNLEVLKLFRAFKGKYWRLNEDVVFQRLKYLRIEYEDLVRWKATSDNFPIFEQLVLRDLSYLEEIPQSIGEITTLKLIEIGACSSGVVTSATKIQEEQESWGNYGLQLQIRKYSFPLYR